MFNQIDKKLLYELYISNLHNLSLTIEKALEEKEIKLIKNQMDEKKKDREDRKKKKQILALFFEKEIKVIYPSNNFFCKMTNK